ncbi:hypothetical protein M2171_005563 [Bradyrhizobium japonicum USDA 38]|uniref:right-handed parallel beta-helix repeat-containing protein n=1 Tax=Bradyrhizobium japonicum TaxID=375 RepID=UPI0004819ED3|nr:right-handed parallel beta-helix repeat-containing protein [Bradyrhizobium japonicum]MCS3896430.1 hypothetical protein [Bradyrhizobium japonicum USDA 38]MCS3948945.1 hypothetical protein [Bradyrhizobium japonicum]
MATRRGILVAAPAILLGLNRWPVEDILGLPARAAEVPPKGGIPSCGELYPDAATTGVPAGAMLANSGSVASTSAGQTIQNLNISGTVRIRHSNVTLKNCLIQANDAYIVECDRGSPTGAVVQDCTISGLNNGGTTGFNPDGGGGGSIIRRCNISGCENGIGIGEDKMQILDNYIHDLFHSVEAHTDGIQATGGFTSLVIRHNSIFGVDTSCIILTNNVGFSGYAIDNNLLVMVDGSAPIIIRPVGPNAIGAGSVTNNKLGRGVGSYNDFTRLQPLPTYTGNVDWRTCGAVTAGR